MYRHRKPHVAFAGNGNLHRARRRQWRRKLTTFVRRVALETDRRAWGGEVMS